MSEKDLVKRVKEVIDKVRPFLQNDGGDIEFRRFEKGVVYVKLTGACSGCPMAEITLQEGIESVIVNEIPEVIKVINEE